jgi:outer membrane autotransporter protein
MELISAGGIANVSLVNDGAVTGGISGGGAPDFYDNDSTGGDGIQLTGSFVNQIAITNHGWISGGAGLNGVNLGNGNWTSIGNGGNGIRFSASSLTHMSLFNSGVISGGNSGVLGGNGGDGIYFDVGNSSDLTINNYGSILGGSGVFNSASGDGGAAGIGVQGTENGLAINNWGLISAGAGRDPAAVSFSGNVNTLNLLGHSTVRGLIESTGNGNVLNFAFSGLDPATSAALETQLSQYLNGKPSTGSITVRGVTYTWDPMIVEWYSNDSYTPSASSYQLQGATPNQQAIGASLDSAATNPAPGSSLFKLYNAIDASGNVPAALEALSPQAYQIYGDIAIENATAIVQSIDQRLNNIRVGSESIDLSGVGAGSAPAGDTEQDADGKVTLRPASAPAPASEKTWGFFATGDGFFFKNNSHDADLNEGRSDAAGMVAGVDAKIDDHAIIGALFGYNRASVTFGGDANIESCTGGIYGAWYLEGIFLNGLVTYTRNNYSSNRDIVFPDFSTTAAGNTNGNQWTLNLDGGYDWHATERLTVSPLLGLQWVRIGVNNFSESGAGAADLAVGQQSTDSLQSRVGGAVNYHFLMRPNAALSAQFHAAWQHEYLNNSRSIDASFEGTGLAPFRVQTSAPSCDAAVLGAGLDFTYDDRLTLYVGYELLVWTRGYIEQTVDGGGKLNF